MALPIQHHALEQIGPSQERRVRRRAATDNDVVAAAGAGVAAVDQETVRTEANMRRLLIKGDGRFDDFAPVLRRVNVDLDHAGIGGDLDNLDTRIVRRGVTFDVNLKLHVLGGRFHYRNQFEIVLELLHRRHERTENAVADLNGQRGADTALSAGLLLLNELAWSTIRQRSAVEHRRLSGRLGWRRCGVEHRQRFAFFCRVLLDNVGIILRRNPLQRIHRQPQTQR